MSQFTTLRVVIGKGVLVIQSQLTISWIVIQNCAKIDTPSITLYTHYYTIIHLNLIRKPILQPKIVLLNFALFIYIIFKCWNVTSIIVMLLLNHISVIFRSMSVNLAHFDLLLSTLNCLVEISTINFNHILYYLQNNIKY